MGTRVTLVIASRDMGCHHRRLALDYTLNYWASIMPYRQPWQLIVEPGRDDASFTRASALNTAIRKAAGDIIIQSDPDSVLATKTQIVEALRLAALADGLVVPHDMYLYLTEEATEYVYRGRPLDAVLPSDCHDVGRDGAGNVTVFSRATWARSGGFDERFGLWGGDDAAFRYATEAFCGPVRRVPGNMIHLWHPRLPQSQPGHPGYVEQFAILAEYRDAAAAGASTVRRLVRATRNDMDGLNGQ